MAHTISYTFAYTFTYANNICAHMIAVGIWPVGLLFGFSYHGQYCLHLCPNSLQE